MLNISQRQNWLADLNEEQRTAALADSTTAVQVLAGPGTGKTRLITSRFMQIVSELQNQDTEQSVNKVLVLTFTEKAAAEMQERIQTALEESGYKGELPGEWISTFHHFCNTLLKRHGYLIGLSLDFRLLEEREEQDYHGFLQKQIRNNIFSSCGEILNKYGLSHLIPDTVLSVENLASLAVDNRVFVLQSIPALLDKVKSSGFSPLEFYLKATGQIKAWSRCLQSLTTGSLENPISSKEDLSRIWSRELSQWAEPSWLEAASEPNMEAKYYDRYIKRILESKNYVEYNRSKKLYFPASQDFSAIQAQTQTELRLVEIIAAYYACYQELLLEESRCDFDDLILYAIQLLESHPHVAEYYQNWFQAILIDEFQDTDASQMRLLKAIRRTDGQGNSNITVVGDEKQSIYGFRFAQKENLDLIFQNLSVLRCPLKQNYRSRPEIIKAANVIADLLTSGKAEQQIQPVIASNDQPSVVWLTIGEEASDSQKSESIAALRLRERNLIAAEVARLVSDGQYQPVDIAILTRGHSKAMSIARALRSFGVPVILPKLLGFYTHPAIQDALALLRLAHDLEDIFGWTRLLQKKLSPRQLRLLIGERPLQDCFSTYLQQRLKRLPTEDFSLETQQALLNFFSLIFEAHQRASNDSTTQLFRWLMVHIGVIETSSSETEIADAAEMLDVFEHLLIKLQADRADGNRYISVILPELLRRAAQDEPVSVDEQAVISANAVRILTAHASKGLEFPVVFAAWTDSTFRGAGHYEDLLIFDPQFGEKPGFGLMLSRWADSPTLKSQLYRQIWQSPRQEDEEKRLFYVAITRAKEKLYLLRARQSSDWTALPKRLAEPGLQILDESEPETKAWIEETLALSPETLRPRVESVLRDSAPEQPDVPQSIRDALLVLDDEDIEPSCSNLEIFPGEAQISGWLDRSLAPLRQYYFSGCVDLQPYDPHIQALLQAIENSSISYTVLSQQGWKFINAQRASLLSSGGVVVHFWQAQQETWQRVIFHVGLNHEELTSAQPEEDFVMQRWVRISAEGESVVLQVDDC